MHDVTRPSRSARDAASGVPLAPAHPERICWGCDKFCPDSELACGNATIRTPHPVELFGDEWVALFDIQPK
jgi:hypothetical protein